MYPEKPVLWLSQSLKAPRDRADTVENVSIRVVTVVVSKKRKNIFLVQDSLTLETSFTILFWQFSPL